MFPGSISARAEPRRPGFLPAGPARPGLRVARLLLHANRAKGRRPRRRDESLRGLVERLHHVVRGPGRGPRQPREQGGAERPALPDGAGPGGRPRGREAQHLPLGRAERPGTRQGGFGVRPLAGLGGGLLRRGQRVRRARRRAAHGAPRVAPPARRDPGARRAPGFRRRRGDDRKERSRPRGLGRRSAVDASSGRPKRALGRRACPAGRPGPRQAHRGAHRSPRSGNARSRRQP